MGDGLPKPLCVRNARGTPRVPGPHWEGDFHLGHGCSISERSTAAATSTASACDGLRRFPAGCGAPGTRPGVSTWRRCASSSSAKGTPDHRSTTSKTGCASAGGSATNEKATRDKLCQPRKLRSLRRYRAGCGRPRSRPGRKASRRSNDSCPDPARARPNTVCRCRWARTWEVGVAPAVQPALQA